jgi:uncharacterized membrane protein
MGQPDRPLAAELLIPTTVVRAAALGWSALCGAVYAAIALIKFDHAVVASYDTAIFEEGIRGYAHGGWPIVAIKGAGFNLLGDHFSPAIAVLAPFYRVFPHTQTILIAQAVLMAISVYVIGSVAGRRLGPWVGGAVAVAYGLSFGLQSAVDAGFHEVALGVPLLALAGAAFVEHRYKAVVGWSLPLLLVKEDLGLTVAAIGIALAIVGERRRGALLAAAGVIGTAVEVWVLIPWARSDAAGYAYALGGDGMLGALGDDPGRKLLTVLLTFAVGGLVAVASPWAVAAIPTLGWRLAADNPYYWGTDWHYSLLLMPVVAIAGVDVMCRVGWTRRIAVVAMLAVTALSVIPNHVVRSALSANLAATTRQTADRERAADKVTALIPAGSVVDADIGLITRLVTGRDVRWIGTRQVDGPPDWIVLDHDPASNISSPTSVINYAAERYASQKYVVALDAWPFEVARRTR